MHLFLFIAKFNRKMWLSQSIRIRQWFHEYIERVENWSECEEWKCERDAENSKNETWLLNQFDHWNCIAIIRNPIDGDRSGKKSFNIDVIWENLKT